MSRPEVNLRAVGAFAELLPQLAAEWDEISEDEQVTCALEWKDAMDRLDALDLAYAGGELTDDQESRYEALRARIASPEVSAAIERTDLHRPRRQRSRP